MNSFRELIPFILMVAPGVLLVLLIDPDVKLDTWIRALIVFGPTFICLLILTIRSGVFSSHSRPVKTSNTQRRIRFAIQQNRRERIEKESGMLSRGEADNSAGQLSTVDDDEGKLSKPE